MFKSKVLILTSSTGGGHDTRARTFKKWLKLLSFRSDVLVESILENSSRLYSLGVSTYNLIQKKCPFMHKLYWWVVEVFLFLELKLFKFKNLRFERVLGEFRPSTIVSVHDCTNKGFFKFAAKTNVGVRCFTYCGEFSGGYGFSKLWVSKYSHNIFCRTSECLNFISSMGVIPNHKLGLCFNVFPPAYFYFKFKLNRVFILRLLKLKLNKFTVFLGSGVVGSNLHKKILADLVKVNGIQVIVVCGKNERTFLEVKKAYSSTESVFVDSFSKKIPFFLKVSHVVITRSGSNLSAESVFWKCIVLPFNFRGVMPQERLTLNYLVNEGLGVPSLYLKSIKSLVSFFVEYPKYYFQIKKNGSLNPGGLSIKDLTNCIK